MAREWWKEERRERETKRIWRRIIDDSIDYVVYYVTRLRIRVTYIVYVLDYKA